MLVEIKTNETLAQKIMYYTLTLVENSPAFTDYHLVKALGKCLIDYDSTIQNSRDDEYHYESQRDKEYIHYRTLLTKLAEHIYAMNVDPKDALYERRTLQGLRANTNYLKTCKEARKLIRHKIMKHPKFHAHLNFHNIQKGSVGSNPFLSK